MSNKVERFFREHYDKIELVAKGFASSPKHKEFFTRIYKRVKWRGDSTTPGSREEYQWLENYINENYNVLYKTFQPC